LDCSYVIILCRRREKTRETYLVLEACAIATLALIKAESQSACYRRGIKLVMKSMVGLVLSSRDFSYRPAPRLRSVAYVTSLGSY
jgi:hypothetical protein